MQFLIRLLSRLPLRLLYVMASVIAFLAYHVVRYRRKVAETNVALCLPHLTAKEQQRVVRRFYSHLADVVVEAVWFGRGSKERLRKQRLVEMSNPQLLNEASQGGRSVMILSSHIGNWEVGGGILNYNYTEQPSPLTEQNTLIVYKALRNKFWDDFMRRNRTAVLDDPEHFEGCIESRQVLRYAVAHRHEQKFYTFITDQRPYAAAKGSLPVTFLGQPCQSMAAGAGLAQHFGFAVLYQRIRNVGRGHYKLEFELITEDASKSTPQEIMDRYYELLTADILKQPEQYLWTHKRFKKSKKNISPNANA